MTFFLASRTLPTESDCSTTCQLFSQIRVSAGLVVLCLGMSTSILYSIFLRTFLAHLCETSFLADLNWCDCTEVVTWTKPSRREKSSGRWSLVSSSWHSAIQPASAWKSLAGFGGIPIRWATPKPVWWSIFRFRWRRSMPSSLGSTWICTTEFAPSTLQKRSELSRPKISLPASKESRASGKFHQNWARVVFPNCWVAKCNMGSKRTRWFQHQMPIRVVTMIQIWLNFTSHVNGHKAPVKKPDRWLEAACQLVAGLQAPS